jgi:hypothetical protein
MEKYPKIRGHPEIDSPPERPNASRYNYIAWLGRLLTQVAINRRRELMQLYERRRQEILRKESRRIRNEIRTQQFS